jgi:hypothetical protein
LDATALVYPSLHRFAVWFVDKIVLHRAITKNCKSKSGGKSNQIESVERILDRICCKLSAVLTAKNAVWVEKTKSASHQKFAAVNYAPDSAAFFVATAEAPFYTV